MGNRRNPFPSPTPLETALLRELTGVARACYERGWSWGTAGNFSLRGQEGTIWQSPSGLNKGALSPDLFIPVDLATATVIWPPLVGLRPSQEMPVHLGIFRAVTEARCVVHTHPPHLVARSRAAAAEGALVFRGDEMQKHLGCRDHLETLRVPIVMNPTPESMPAMAGAAGRHIVPGVPMIVLAVHGVYAWGRTPLEALSFIEAAEFLCRTNPGPS